MDKLAKILNKKTGFVDMLCFIAGAVIYALSMNIFILPHKLIPGGISGVASILQNTVGWDVGIMYFVLNVPLFIIALIMFGFRFISKTFISMTLVSFFIELISKVFPTLKYLPDNADPAVGLIAAICAGVGGGLGLAIIFLRGATTGGTEIAAKVLRKWIPGAPFGKLLFGIDLCVVLSGYIIFKVQHVPQAENSVIFSLIAIFLTSTVIDAVLDGNSVARVALIISDKTNDIKHNLLEGLGRGVTVIRAAGGYTNKEVYVIMCALRRHQVQSCRAIVKECDSNAFLIILHATEVLGEGFEEVNKETL